MSAKQKPVNTPLHLLQQLSGSLLEHLETACSEALADAEKLLANAISPGALSIKAEAHSVLTEIQSNLH